MTIQPSPSPDPYDSAARQQRREQSGRELCRRHARPLLSLASVLFEDLDTASEVVSGTIAVACDTDEYTDLSAAGMRVRLARSVYQRSLGRLAVRERFGLRRRPVHRVDIAGRAVAGAMTLDTDRRALVALITFGGHNLAQAAITLDVTPEVVLNRLQEILDALSPRTTGAHLADAGRPSIGPPARAGGFRLSLVRRSGRDKVTGRRREAR